ncbi:MAG: family 16 glycosylhydrolase [Treponema sp.]|nr:family 16 glycosylhydrolase [Treponema sp.]
MKKTYVFGIAAITFLLIGSIALLTGCKAEAEDAPQAVIETVNIRLNNTTVTGTEVSGQKDSTLTFSARVSGTNNPVETVTWRRTGFNGSSTTGTSIDRDSGVFIITNTAEEGALITVIATPVADESKAVSVTVKITAGVVQSVTITTATASVAKGSTLQFNATAVVTGSASTAVTWSITSSGHHAGTSINAVTGLLEVALDEPQSNITVRAASAQPGYANVADTKTVSLTAAQPPAVHGITVTTAGSVTAVAQGANLQFYAAVDVSGGATTAVTWSLVGSNAAGTSINSSGLLTVAAAQTASITVRATTALPGSTIFGERTVTITLVPVVNSVTITPAGNATSVAQGGTLQFNASVNATGGAGTGVSWSLVGGPYAGGTNINASGLLTVAGNEAQTAIHVRAASTQPGFTDVAAQRAIDVAPTPVVTGVTITAPASGASVDQGATQQFSATAAVSGGATTNINWSIESSGHVGTSINGNGLLTVGANEPQAQITVRAASAQPGFTNIFAERIITVNSVIPQLPEGVVYQIYKAGVLDPRFTVDVWNSNAAANGYNLAQNNAGRSGAQGIRLHNIGDTWGRGISINANTATTVDWSTVDALSFWIRATGDITITAIGLLDDQGEGNDPFNIEYTGENNTGIQVTNAPHQRHIIPIPKTPSGNRRQVFKIFIAAQGTGSTPYIQIDDIALMTTTSKDYAIVIPAVPQTQILINSSNPIATVIGNPYKVTYTLSVPGLNNRQVSLFSNSIQLANWYTITYPVTGAVSVSGANLTAGAAAGNFTLRVAFDGTPKSNTLNGSVSTGAYSPEYSHKNFDPSLTSFYDKFEGTTVDPNKWGRQNGWGNWGWGNNERQYYRTENAQIVNGNLRLIAERTPGVSMGGSQQYASGKLVTANGDAGAPGGNSRKFGQTYGRFEAKIRMSHAAAAFWPAFWMMPVANSYTGGWPRNGEIDIMEMIGHLPAHAAATIHMQAPWMPSGQSHYRGWGVNTFENGSTIADWHVYGVRWEPDRFIWLLDGKELGVTMFNALPNPGSYQGVTVGGVTQTTATPVGHPFHHDFFMILNFALDRGSQNGGYNPNSNIPEAQLTATLPAYMEVEWVRVYTIANDPWGRPTQTYPGRATHNN